MQSWAIIGPLLTTAGLIAGLGVGWGVMKSTVRELTEAVNKLDKISTDVTVLQTQHIRVGADVADILRRVHSLELTVARAGLGDPN
jgi:hypothetical protein